MPSCRSCGEAIVWAENDRSGKTMPFNPDPVEHGRWVLLVLSGKRTAVYDATRVHGWVAHFATCPNRVEHRKGGRYA